MSPTQSEFITVLSETFSPTVSLSGDTLFRELEDWSSMQALIVIATIDENYGITIPEKSFRKASTVKDLFALTTLLKNG